MMFTLCSRQVLVQLIGSVSKLTMIIWCGFPRFCNCAKDLIWGSVKHYCGIVLDRETRTLLGTAVLFVPPDPSMSGCSTFFKSAWVTCVKVVEGRTEVLIKTSKGGIHVAQLMLTSTTLGLALFSVHVWQGTFALAFLSRVTGPASLPHRLFVDVARNDRVYVIG